MISANARTKCSLDLLWNQYESSPSAGENLCHVSSLNATKRVTSLLKVVSNGGDLPSIGTVGPYDMLSIIPVSGLDVEPVPTLDGRGSSNTMRNRRGDRHVL